MYELILLLLAGVGGICAYVFACRLVVVNSITCPSLQFSHYFHSSRVIGALDFVKMVVDSLRDTEQGFFVRISSLLSNSVTVEKNRAQLSLLASKIGQCLIAVAMFLPIKYFVGFLAFVVITAWATRKSYSPQCFGIILGLALMKCCIEFMLYLLSINTGISPDMIPGNNYIQFAIEHPWMLILNGALFVPSTINLYMALPVVLLTATVVNLNLYHLFLLLLGFLLGLSLKSLGQSRPVRGIISGLLKENCVFYFLWSFWLIVGFLGLTTLYPEIGQQAVEGKNLVWISLVLAGFAVLAAVSFRIVIDKGLLVVDMARPKSKHGEKLLYKYPKKIFKEAEASLDVLMNEMRRYSAKQSVYFEKTQQWFEGQLIDASDIERIHNNFLMKGEELQDYLTTVQKSQDAQLYEEAINICSKFLEGAKSLEKNFYEKCKILEAEQEEQVRMEHSPFFNAIIEADDAVFFVYETALRTLSTEDVDSLIKVLDHEGSVLSDIEAAYVTNRQHDVTENAKKLALELVNMYQINLWQMSKQAELLQQWLARIK